jgi:hypothetical protein
MSTSVVVCPRDMPILPCGPVVGDGFAWTVAGSTVNARVTE